MMKLALAIGLTALLSTSAVAQSSQSPPAGAAGANSHTMTIDDSGMANPAARSGATGNGTTGLNTGAAAGSGPERGSPNGSPAAPPKATTGPNGMPSNNETPPK
jgi:hypothetical protein